ncbi:MAG TPA: hypothetical protein VF207_04625 [Chthoniobacterales bacterium]
MAWRIEDNVVRGEIDNRTPGRVEGRVWLTGRSDPLVLRLTGNCHIDLAGCRLMFSNPAPKPDSGITLASDQSGVVGDITAACKVRVIEGFDYDAIKAGKRLPEHLANSLYVEWFSDANGRVVIETTQYEISVSEPVWRMSPEEEAQQHKANAEAMQSFMDRLMGTPDAREEAAYEGAPKDEFEWELFLRASDRRVTKLGELMEKYHDSPDRDRLIARAMGWTEIEELLAAEAESDIEEQPEITDLAADEDPGAAGGELKVSADEEGLAEFEAIDDNPMQHPLVAGLLERSTTLMKLAEDKRDQDLEEMVASFIAVGPKVAGALGSVMRGWDEELGGLAVAKLKRAMGELSRALNAASRLKQKNAELPFAIDDWVTEMLKIRQELLLLMNQFRGKRE